VQKKLLSKKFVIFFGPLVSNIVFY